ncbi:sugar phosphate nucleotidyltransferase [Shewanella surugensis]|uniref:sugar phosphate nucleotidyltransferase n=1 Tax=Shewanella surugensis TaxID=212020 RepID=UPI00289D5A87|nr:sugar phosphate nucleotidyltransferase [Shewanella surugensis]
MKGIILAGGSGTRLYPLTQFMSKQLLLVNDKPMIFYPLALLMQMGIKEILIITTQQDAITFQQLLGDGSRFGISLDYAVQHNPEGIAQAFIIGEPFIGDDNVCLILGDNFFYADPFDNPFKKQFLIQDIPLLGAKVFGYHC